MASVLPAGSYSPHHNQTQPNSRVGVYFLPVPVPSEPSVCVPACVKFSQAPFPHSQVLPSMWLRNGSACPLFLWELAVMHTSGWGGQEPGEMPRPGISGSHRPLSHGGLLTHRAPWPEGPPQILRPPSCVQERLRQTHLLSTVDLSPSPPKVLSETTSSPHATNGPFRGLKVPPKNTALLKG